METNRTTPPLTLLKTVENSVDDSVIARIPSDIRVRCDFLHVHLDGYANKTIYSKDLNANVIITQKTIDETCLWAKLSRTSAIMALNMANVVANATRWDVGLKPKSGKQTKKFKFQEMRILWLKIRRHGVAKLTVGIKKTGKVFEYCITDFYALEKIKETADASSEPEGSPRKSTASGCKGIKKILTNKKINKMAKMTKKELSAMGRKITGEAKRIHKASPKKKWTTCMKEAGKKLKGKL